MAVSANGSKKIEFHTLEVVSKKGNKVESHYYFDRRTFFED